MRKVIFGVANSLDNFVARRDGGYDWILWSDEVAELVAEFWPRIDAVLVGRKTYEVQQQMPVDPDMAMPSVTTYVFSRTLTQVEGENVELVSQEAGEFVRELKQRPGKDICLMGGGELARSLFVADVIDEVSLHIHPILLGDGIPLFLPMPQQTNLQLRQCRPFEDGCIMATYDVVHRG
jgi:dihydrofolate reductase